MAALLFCSTAFAATTYNISLTNLTNKDFEWFEMNFNGAFTCTPKLGGTFKINDKVTFTCTDYVYAETDEAFFHVYVNKYNSSVGELFAKNLSEDKQNNCYLVNENNDRHNLKIKCIT